MAEITINFPHDVGEHFVLKKDNTPWHITGIVYFGEKNSFLYWASRSDYAPCSGEFLEEDMEFVSKEELINRFGNEIKVEWQ